MKKKGLKLKPGEIYNERGTALSGAIVAVDYGMGTGSVISDRGLVITNHHVAYGDIHDLSTPENNYLENGFWAATEQDELPVKGKTVMFLRRIADVTDEAMEMRDSMIRSRPFRRIRHPEDIRRNRKEIREGHSLRSLLRFDVARGKIPAVLLRSL